MYPSTRMVLIMEFDAKVSVLLLILVASNATLKF